MKRFLLLLAMILLVLLPATSVMAKDPAVPELSIKEAVERALANSEAVKKAVKEVDRTEILREQRQKKLDYTPIGTPDNPAVEVAWANLLSADLNRQMSKKSLVIKEDAVALDACKKYWQVQLSQGALEVARLALKQADLDLNQAKLFQRVGLITIEDLLGAEKKQVAAKASLNKAKNDLETAYHDFNQLVGLWPEDRPLLTDELIFTPMENTDVDYLVAVALESDPTVWLANEKVTQQKYLEDLMYASGGEYTSYEIRKIETEQVNLDAVSTQKNVETKIRNMFYNVLTMEESYPSLEQDVRLAEENLRVLNLKFKLGMATKLDVAASEYSLNVKRLALLELKNNHAYMKLALQKPWAYSY